MAAGPGPTRSDRLVIGGLSLTLVLLAATVIGPALTPAAAGPTATPAAAAAPWYREGILGGFTNVSPFGARTAADRILVALTFRSLVRLGPGEALVPDLAERWEVDPAGSTWTFHLRSGSEWQDGSPITAADVTFTIDALSDPEYGGPEGASWREVRAREVDPLTVRLELATPLGDFLEAATQPIAPAHLLGSVPVAQLADDAFGQHPVGSGPFEVASLDPTQATLPAWTQASSAVSTAAPGAEPSGPANLGSGPSGGLPEPYLPGVELHFYEDVPTLEAAWRAGELDAVSGLSPTDLSSLADESSGATIRRYPGATLLAVVPNLRATRPALRDAAVRRALLEAIDRDAIVRDVLAGQGRRADAPIPPTSWAFDPEASPAVPFDASAATAGLEAAGWKHSDAGWTPKGATEALTIEILGPARDVNPVAFATAEAVSTAWRAIGLATTHVELPAAELADRLRAGEFDVAVIGVNVGLDPDLYPLLASTQTAGARTNVLGLQDPSLDALLAAARAPATDEARKAAYSALQVRLAAGTYLLPLAFRDEAAIVTNHLTGAVIRPVGDPGGRFWDVLTWRLANDR